MTSSHSPQVPHDQKEMRLVLKKMMGAALILTTLLILGLVGMSYYKPTHSSPSQPTAVNFNRSLSKTPIPEIEGLSWRSQYTLVSFWAAWCAPCVEELPALNTFAQDLPQIRVVMINIDSKESDTFLEAKKMLARLGHPSFENIFSEASTLEKMGGQSLPAHFLVSPNREIVWSHQGALDWASESQRSQILAFIASENKQGQGQPEN